MFKEHYPQLFIPPPHGYGPDALDVEGKWYFAGPPVAVDQGWKLYVSATRPNFLRTLDAVKDVFAQHGVSYKYVASDKVLRKLNAGLYGYSQVGKVIIAYFAEGVDVSAVVQSLKHALHEFRHCAPLPPFALPLGGGLPLSYRYGSFGGIPLRLGGREFEDDRNRSADWVRDHVEDPFKALCELPVDRSAFDRLLSRFPVYEVLSQGGKGGVYAAFDIEAPEFCDLILKIGCRHGQILPDGRDGMDLLRHEHDFFGCLLDRSLTQVAPRLHGYFEFEDRNVLAMERVDGENLLKRKIDGALGMGHVTAALDILSRLHDAGLYAGDPKLANFVADDSGRVFAIDFESAGLIERPRFDLLRTFHFSRPKITDVAARERIHFLYSVVHKEDGRSFSEGDRVIDLVAFVRDFVSADTIEQQVLALLERELERADQIG